MIKCIVIFHECLLNLYIDFFMIRVGGGCIHENSIGPGTDYKGNQGQTLDLYTVRPWLYLGPTMYDDSAGLPTTGQDSLALIIQPSAVDRIKLRQKITMV